MCGTFAERAFVKKGRQVAITDGDQSEFMQRLTLAEIRQEELRREVAAVRATVQEMTALVLRHVTRRQDFSRSPLDLES